jgi:hypothetical protein
MRKILMTTVATIAIASPAFAADMSHGSIPGSAPMVAGDFELSLGGGYDDESEKTINRAGAWARANMPVNGTWNVLVEGGAIGDFNWGDGYEEKSESKFSVNGHLWTGDGTRYGAFGGATFGVWQETYGVVGVEAETDIGNATVGAQGFYTWLPGDDYDGFGGVLWGDYYFTPNTKATGTLTYTALDDGDDNLFSASGRVTHRLDGTPFNFFGEASYGAEDWDGSDLITVVTGSVGFTVNFDGPGYSQQEHDGQVPFSFRSPLAATTPYE